MAFIAIEDDYLKYVPQNKQMTRQAFKSASNHTIKQLYLYQDNYNHYYLSKEENIMIKDNIIHNF